MVFKFNATVITAGLILLLTGCASTEELKKRYTDKFNQDVAQDYKKMVEVYGAIDSPLPKIVNYRAFNSSLEECDANRWNFLNQVGPEIRGACFGALKAETILEIMKQTLNSTAFSPQYEMDVITRITSHDRGQGSQSLTDFFANVSVETEFASRDSNFSIKGSGIKKISDDRYVTAFGMYAKAYTVYELALKSAFYQSVADAIPRVSRNLEEFRIASSSKKAEPATNQSPPAANLKDAKEKCTDLGFKKDTEKFGECVLKLSE